MPLVVRFPDARSTSIAQVGGKAHALIRLAADGVPVPQGVALGVDFFEPWLAQVRVAPAWAELRDANPADWPAICGRLKQHCEHLETTKAQHRALAEVREELGDTLLAVRSSSPEEDLAAAAFAGQYETRLGVRPDGLESAVRACFASALDHRVLAYKRRIGLDVLAPRIAVIVQRQLDADVAGVAFSLDPLTNDYDHAVIDANWGLGESVVAGQASPDHFVIDRPTGRVLDRRLGNKQASVRLTGDGGTAEQVEPRAGEFCLDDAQLAELTETVNRIEALFGHPVDIEWAYADGKLWVLQARPITAWVPLPPEMRTEPGQPRRLYNDISLAKGFATNAPISPLGLDWMAGEVDDLVEHLAGRRPRPLPIEDALWFFAGGRMYQNLSNMFWLMGPQAQAASARPTDVLLADTIAGIDRDEYRSPKRPPWAGLGLLRALPGVLLRLAPALGRMARALLSPDRARRIYDRDVAALERELADGINDTLPLGEFRRRCEQTRATIAGVMDTSMPALMAAMTATGLLNKVAGRSPKRRELAERMKLGYGGNVVVDMGIALHRLAERLDPADLADPEALADRVARRDMPADFLAAWDDFIARFGCRGPGEMDLANPRYGDDPALAVRQLSQMAVGDAALDPAAAHERRVAQRRAAYRELLGRLGPMRRALLRHLHRVLERFAGVRDTPKQHNLLYQYAVRRRVLIEGRRLADAGRLDAPEDIFGLTFADIDRAAEDTSLDLRRIRERRMRFIRKLEAMDVNFPPVIDSRGRIPRPIRPEPAAGELVGMPVSSGIARGAVKVLHRPDAGRIEPGDVLVAYITDPGWTPLFASAAAVVLQVGGTLQHGAVVAREYGRPCVAGIEGVTEKLRDGQVVEVDGSAGVVRIISDG